MALDSVNDRMFIPAYGNGGYRGYMLNQDGTARDRSSGVIISRESIYGRRAAPRPSVRGNEYFPATAGIIDNSTQRLFSLDRFNNRLLVYDISPETLEPYPDASVTIGQPDFESTLRGTAANRTMLSASAAIDEQNQRLFLADPPNHRVLLFDIHPDRLRNDPDAYAVIGQDGFDSQVMGGGPSGMMMPMSVAYDPDYKRLFVSDSGNNRVLVYNADPDDPDAMKQAVAVMGQADFQGRAPRESLDQLKPEGLAYDWRHHRLFISEDLNHRIMVYDAHPDRIGGDTRAIAAIGQPDMFSTHPAVSRTRLAMPRVSVDSLSQKMYVSEGYPAGNRISVWDISPENLRTGMPAIDVFGHETPDGGPDFDNRMAQGHIDGRSLAAARSVELDLADHRLFVGDEYNHRVVVYQLDRLNRLVDREADWVLGQPDLETSLFGEPGASNMTVPLDVAYDASTKRLFVGDGYHNRILVYDIAPGQLENGMAASHVIGQPDFNTTTKAAGRSGINFDVRMGRGIASDFLPLGFAIDEENQRLFASDGANNRILVYDIRPGILDNGPDAIGVLGQADYESTEPQADGRGLSDPGHLAFDAVNQRLFAIDAKRKRVLVFDVDPGRFENGAEAIAVLGQPDFSAKGGTGGGMMSLPFGGPPSPQPVNARTFWYPNGIEFDPVKQWLYVADGGGTRNIPADRILVFDADPATLENGAAATTAFGALDADTGAAAYFGGSSNYPGQFNIRDTRGIGLDYEHGRIFATGSFESRVVAFYFPRASWSYDIAAGEVQSFGTLDAADLGGRKDERTLSSAVLDGEGSRPGGITLYSVTHPMVDARSQRHSRVLVSEAAIGAQDLVRSAAVYVEPDDRRRHDIHIYNPGSRSTAVDLVLRDGNGLDLDTWQREVASGEQLTIEVESLAVFIPQDATISLEASRDIGVIAIRRTVNSRGDTVIAPAPMAAGGEPAEYGVVPYFVNGGNHVSQLVLMNPTGEAMQGTVAFYSGGSRQPLGTVSELIPYHIAPHSTHVIRGDGAGPSAVEGHLSIDASAGGLPHASVLTRRKYGDTWTNESLTKGVYGVEAIFAADQRPNPVRHGEIDTVFVVVNTGETGAVVEISLDGEPVGSQNVAPGEQATISLGALAGAEAHGLVRLTSSSPVSMGARQVTTSLRAESVETGLPAIVEISHLPLIVNGDGISTEIRLANSGPGDLAGQINFFRPDSEPARETILR